tara:strand:+ start:21092 stop:21547 length:456 start_codon:yes stop_codon:yes gene_type:complete
MEVAHFSASSLLDLKRSSAPHRSVEQAHQDQQRLVKAVNQIRESANENLILLDAHSLMLVDGKLFKVPNHVIDAIKPNGLVFIKADPDIILRRRSGRGDSGASDLESEELGQMQLMALQAVEDYALAFNLPLSIVEADQPKDFSAAITKFL